MEVRVVFHDADSVSLNGVGQHHGRPVSGASCLSQGVAHLGDVVTVYLNHTPAKGPPLGGQRLKLHNVIGETVVLNAVTVHNGYEVAQTVVGSRHSCLPHLPFVTLAVSQQGVDLVPLVGQPGG